MITTTNSNHPILEIRDLSVHFRLEEGIIEAIHHVSLNIPQNKTVAILGESGCGKSVTALSILRLIDPPGRIVRGSILLRSRKYSDGAPVDLIQLDPSGEQIRSIRGNEISMIFQEPINSLTPVYTIGEQILEAVVLHQKVTRKEAREIAIEALRQVGIPAPQRRVDEYPHQLSGGMCQRAMIALALSCHPQLLIADEPTTALDVTIQAQVLDLLKQIQQTKGTAILLITHDLGVVSEMADEVVVMYLGRVVEKGTLEQVFLSPQHPYTRALFQSVPSALIKRSQVLPSIPGTVPDYSQAPKGCAFRSRCTEEMHICQFPPKLLEDPDGHQVACWLYQEDDSDIQEEEFLDANRQGRCCPSA